MACEFKKRQRCRIQAPEFLRIENLEDKIKAEQDIDNQDKLEHMPFHYMEIASLVLACARDDIPDLARVRSALQTLEEIRSSKLRVSLKAIGVTHDPLELTGASAMEIHQIKTAMTSALDEFARVAKFTERDTAPAGAAFGGGGYGAGGGGGGGAAPRNLRRGQRQEGPQ